MAANAIGICDKYVGLEQRWPWLTNEIPYPTFSGNLGAESALTVIYLIFDFDVMHTGKVTLDQLIDWVRSVEPKDSPEVESQIQSPALQAEEKVVYESR